MSDESKEDRARRLVADHLGCEPDRVTADAAFIDDLGADSLDSVELTMAIEEEFKVEMNDDTSERILMLGKFGDLTDWLNEQA